MIEINNKKSRGFRALLWDIWEWYKSRKKSEQDKKIINKKVADMKEELLNLSGTNKIKFLKYLIELLKLGPSEKQHRDFTSEPFHATYMNYKNTLQYLSFVDKIKDK